MLYLPVHASMFMRLFLYVQPDYSWFILYDKQKRLDYNSLLWANGQVG